MRASRARGHILRSERPLLHIIRAGLYMRAAGVCRRLSGSVMRSCRAGLRRRRVRLFSVGQGAQIFGLRSLVVAAVCLRSHGLCVTGVAVTGVALTLSPRRWARWWQWRLLLL